LTRWAKYPLLKEVSASWKELLRENDWVKNVLVYELLKMKFRD
jgi:hypothetical protein